jgi:hypothetical protein
VATEVLRYVRDLIDNALTLRKFTDPAGPSQKVNFDLAIIYDLANGLTFPDKENRERFIELAGLKPPKPATPAPAGVFAPKPEAEVKIPRDPAMAFDLVEKVLKIEERKGPDGRDMHTLFIVNYAESLVPAGTWAQLGDKDRYCIVKLLDWAKDPVISNNSNPTILITDSTVHLHDSLTSSGSRIEVLEIMLPSPEERLSYIEEMEENLFADTGQKLNFEKGFDKQKFAHLTAGLKKLNVEDIKLTANQAKIKIGPDVVKARKSEIYKSEYASVLEIVDPELGFEVVGGMNWLKDWLRRAVIEPMLNGNTKRCPMGLLLADAGGCQPTGQKVLMATGEWKNIEDIRVGDLVASPQVNGVFESVSVESTVAHSNQRVYRIRTRSKRGNHREYLCSWNHVIPMTVITHKKQKGVSARTKELAEMEVGKFLERGREFRRNACIFTAPAFDLPERNFPLHPYVLGCLLGDGGLTRRLSKNKKQTLNPTLSKSEPSVLKKLRRLGLELGKNVSRRVNLQFNVVGKSAKKIKQLSVWGCGSGNKFVPDEYKRGSLTQRLELLAGLVDTDGTKEEFSSTSHRLAVDFYELIHSVGGTASIHQRTTKCQTGATCVSYRVNYSVGECDLPVATRYKHQKARNFGWKNHRSRSFDVEYVDVQAVYGFRLAGGSQWYVTNGWLITRNAGITIAEQERTKESSRNGSECLTPPIS